MNSTFFLNLLLCPDVFVFFCQLRRRSHVDMIVLLYRCGIEMELTKRRIPVKRLAASALTVRVNRYPRKWFYRFLYAEHPFFGM